MLKPTFRFIAMPLAAICALAALSMQPATSRTARDASVAVREQVVDCSGVRASEVCVISADRS